MFYIKEFNTKKVIISDSKNDYVLEACGNEEFDQDVIEDILDYENRKEREETK